MTQLLNRAAIDAAITLKHEDVEVPEWGGTARLREMTGEERDRWEAETFTASTEMVDGKPVARFKPNTANMRARLVALCLVDEAGNRCFGDDEVVALGKKSAAALNRCFAVAQRLNGIGVQAAEEAEKNSAGAPSDAPS